MNLLKFSFVVARSAKVAIRGRLTAHFSHPRVAALAILSLFVWAGGAPAQTYTVLTNFSGTNGAQPLGDGVCRAGQFRENWNKVAIAAVDVQRIWIVIIELTIEFLPCA